jgi:hypothetical protein
MLQRMRCCHNSGLNIRIFPLDSRGISRFITHDIGAQRYGTFKDLFRNDVVFVYGTAGDKEERAWAFNKSRFDAERFWYQGNGSIEVTSDTGLEWGAHYVFIRPRAGSKTACVGAAGGTGIRGMRLTDRMPYLLPGVAFPDVIIARTSLLSPAPAACLDLLSLPLPGERL